jgi:hypothetical protein
MQSVTFVTKVRNLLTLLPNILTLVDSVIAQTSSAGFGFIAQISCAITVNDR